jgi:hypothetical protein
LNLVFLLKRKRKKKVSKKLAILTLLICFSAPAKADPLVQQFKSPSFNGYGWSQHVQSIDAQERSREQAIKDAEAARIALARAEAANTPLAKFMALFTSQVYAQLATQLSNNLFAEGSAQQGIFTLDGNTISYVKTGTSVTLTVVDAAGNTTVVTVPIATFGF